MGNEERGRVRNEAPILIPHSPFLFLLLHLRETPLNFSHRLADLILARLVGRYFELALQLDARKAE
jgi:hypothetical protein